MVTQVAPEKPDPDHVLTWRQRKILRVIRDSVQARGYPPSMREIGDAVGLTSIASVSYQLATLQKKGFLHRDGRRPRTMEVVLPVQRTASVTSGAPGEPASAAPGEPGPERIPPRDLPEPVYVPMVARLAPGVPVLADEQIQDVYPLPRQLVGDGTLFLITMAGDSMISAAIADGDWLVVRQLGERDEAEDGAIVAAMLDGEAVVRRLKRSDGHVWLMAHHPGFFPLLGDSATILGTVVALLRRV
jgi:repressor LexA